VAIALHGFVVLYFVNKTCECESTLFHLPLIVDLVVAGVVIIAVVILVITVIKLRADIKRQYLLCCIEYDVKW